MPTRSFFILDIKISSKSMKETCTPEFTVRFFQYISKDFGAHVSFMLFDEICMRRIKKRLWLISTKWFKLTQMPYVEEV